MVKSAAWRRKLGLWGLWVLATLCGLTILVVFLGPVADLLGKEDVQGVPKAIHGAQLPLAIDAVRGRILQLGGGLLALGALIFTARSFTLARRQSEINRRTFELGWQGQVTDRYARAIEQLGSLSEDVRIGGIYALERIAADSDRDRATIMEVLAAFIRRRSEPEDSALHHDESDSRPPSDIVAAITVVGRSDISAGKHKIDLHGACLSQTKLARAALNDADLSAANLKGADLSGAQLVNANLIEADLTGANLRSADLSSARLDRANLSGADLTDAILIEACLSKASSNDARLTKAQCSRSDLSGLSLRKADLTGAELSHANLESADLTDAILSGAVLDMIRGRGARLVRANMSGASVVRGDLSNAVLTNAIFSEARLTETILKDANLFEVQFTNADLTGVDLMTLSKAGLNLEGAKVGVDARLPDGWTRGENGYLSRVWIS